MHRVGFAFFQRREAQRLAQSGEQATAVLEKDQLSAGEMLQHEVHDDGIAHSVEKVSVKQSDTEENDTEENDTEIAGAPTDDSYLDQGAAPQWLAGMDEIPEVSQYKARSYEYLQLHPGMQALELGCGVGDDAARIAAYVQPGGSVLGIDTNPKMILEARSRHLDASKESLPADMGSRSTMIAEGLSFLVAPAEGIPLPDESIDAVRADRVLQHVSDPLIALQEVKRVLRPGGRVVLVEPDWRMMAIHPGSSNGGDDDHVLQAVLNWQGAHTRHPLIGRQLGARLRQAGFADIRVIPVAYSSSSFAVVRYALELGTAGEAAAREEGATITQEELEAWFTAAALAEASGEFSSTVVLTFALAIKSMKSRRPY